MKIDGILFCLFMNKLMSITIMLIWMEFEKTRICKLFLDWLEERMNGEGIHNQKLIHCKDCNWWDGRFFCIRTASGDFDEDDYCSLAERKGEKE